MLNIISISKNIGYKQQIQVETGQSIVALLEDIRDQSAFISYQLTSQTTKLEAADEGIVNYANEVLLHELALLQTSIVALFEKTVAIDSTSFSQAAQTGETAKLSMLLEQLQTTTYIEDTQLASELLSLVNDINSSTTLFNYKLADVKAAMIRMSNGFEWKEAVLSLDQAVSK